MKKVHSTQKKVKGLDLIFFIVGSTTYCLAHKGGHLYIIEPINFIYSSNELQLSTQYSLNLIQKSNRVLIIITYINIYFNATEGWILACLLILPYDMSFLSPCYLVLIARSYT